jgi:hypothetical protein
MDILRTIPLPAPRYAHGMSNPGLATWLVMLVACSSAPKNPVVSNTNGTSAPPPTSFPADAVVIRACNATDRDFAYLEFNSYEDRSGALAAGQCTPYRVDGQTQYNYTYAKFRVGADDFVIQPIDFMGEKALEPGHYSYQITIDDYAKRSASIAAKSDR